MSPAMAVFLMLCSFCFSPTYATAAPTPVPTTITPTASPSVSPTAATTTVSCSSGKFITKINLSAGSYVNGITSITCSDNAVIQVSSGLTGTPYTAISGDGTYLSLGYCSYKSGLSSSFVTQLKFIECTGGLDGTYGTTSATLKSGRCPTGQKAIGISFARGGGFLTSFAFVCGTITRNVSCTSGTYITSITLWSRDVVYGISSITCSDGEIKRVNTGYGGSPQTANSPGGYCKYSTGLSGSFITQFTLGECGTSVTHGPFGSNTAAVTMYGCSSGQKAGGVRTTTGPALTSFSFFCATVTTAAPTPATPTAAPTPAPTRSRCSCPNGVGKMGVGCTTCERCHTGFYLASSQTCEAGYYFCPTGQLVRMVNLRSGDGLNYFDSFACTDGSTVHVRVGNEAGGIYYGISGPFNSYSSGYYTGNTAATSGLYFSSSDSTDSATYGTVYSSRTTKSCPAGMYLSGFHVLPIASNSLVSLGSTAICTAGGTCSCENGVGEVGAVGCAACQSCYTGYASNPHDSALCDPTTVVTCLTAGTFITQLQIRQWGTGVVEGITLMKCSDGSTVSVNAGGNAADDVSLTATAGDGSSSSPGYCASSEKYQYGGASQLKLTECTGGVDGPYGTANFGISVTKTCGIGEKAIGVETTIVPDEEYTTIHYLQYFSIVCGPIP